VSADEDEAAAVVAAILTCLAESPSVALDLDAEGRWARAGRLEAQGLGVSKERLNPGWRASCFDE
jgi:hypothetical protein